MGGRELSTNSEELLVQCLNILKPPKPPKYTLNSLKMTLNPPQKSPQNPNSSFSC